MMIEIDVYYCYLSCFTLITVMRSVVKCFMWSDYTQHAISSLTFRGAILYNLDKIANCDRAIDVDIRLKTRPENFSCRVLTLRSKRRVLGSQTVCVYRVVFIGTSNMRRQTEKLKCF